MSSEKSLAEAWQDYYACLNVLHKDITTDDRYVENPECRAKAMQGLLEAQAMSYRLAVTPRTELPMIETHSWFGDIYTLGGTSPDFYYGALFLDGKKSYRLSGNIGDQKMIVLQGYNHLMGHPESTLLGNFDLSELGLDDNGNFDIVFSAEKVEGNWIPLDASSSLNFFFIRRAIDDWNKNLGTMNITPLEPIPYHDEQDEALMAERIVLATHFMTYLVRNWLMGIYQYFLAMNDGEPNKLVVAGGETIAGDKMGSPSTYYIWGAFEIEDDEALIIEYQQPQAAYWSFQLFDVWNKPLDFVNRQTDLNMNRATVDDDGVLRMVVAHHDPGIANWLDCAGRKRGELLGRNYIPQAKPGTPTVTRVKFNDIRKTLPESTHCKTQEERARDLAYRRVSYRRMHDRTLGE